MLSLTLKGRYTPLVNIAVDRMISSLFIVGIDTQRQIYPPFNTVRGQSDLFTVQCCHWHSKADIPPSQHYQRTEWSFHCWVLSLTLKGRYTPHSTLSEDRVISSLFNVVIDTQRQIYPHSQQYQRKEWSLHCSLLALTIKGRYTPHSTLSEDRVISSLFNVVIDTQREIYPQFNTVRGQSDLFTVECCHWHSKADIHPIQHYQRTEWSLHCSMLSLILKGRYTPTVNTIRGQSDLFTVQCCHWHSKADITPWSTLSEHRLISSLFSVFIDNQRQIYPPIQHYQRTEWSLHCSVFSLTLKERYTPQFNAIRGQSDLFTVQCCHWHSKADIPPGQHSSGQSDLLTVQCCHWHSKADIPLIQHYQRTEWSLHCSMLSLTLKGRYTPLVNIAVDRVISSLFIVGIDNQRQIYPHSQHYQRTEWSLHCSMLSLTLKGRYNPLFNTIRGQSDLFTVQCCHWDSKADIPPCSTLSEYRVISSLFNVVIDIQR